MQQLINIHEVEQQNYVCEKKRRLGRNYISQNSMDMDNSDEKLLISRVVHVTTSNLTLTPHHPVGRSINSDWFSTLKGDLSILTGSTPCRKIHQF